METIMDSMLAIKTNGELTHIVYKDLRSHNNVFYKVEELSVDEIKDLFDRGIIKNAQN